DSEREWRKSVPNFGLIGGPLPGARRSRGAARLFPEVPSPAESPAMNEREIFFEALDRDDPAEQALFLHDACAADAALRQRIEALVRGHAKAGDFLDTPAAQQLAAKGDTPAERPEAGVPLDFLAPSQRAGALGRLGHYEVLEVVGQGGMGVVLR